MGPLVTFPAMAYVLGGDSVGLTKLIRDGQAPSAFLSLYASVTAGTASEIWWAGLSASAGSISINNNPYIPLIVGIIPYRSL